MNSDETREPDSVDESVSDETGVDDAEQTGAAAEEADTAGDGSDEAGADTDAAGTDAETTDAETTDAEATDVPDTKQSVETGHRHWAASFALAVAVAALVGAVVCLGYFGYTGIRAYTVDAPREEMRVEVVDSAEQAMLNILTVDKQGVDVWQKRMKSSLTGDALKQAIDETSAGAVKQIEAARAKNLTISAKVLRSAVTELNVDEETATVFVLSEAATSDAPDNPQPQSSLMSMVKADGVWKATKIVPLSDIAYYDDSAEPQGTQQEGGN